MSGYHLGTTQSTGLRHPSLEEGAGKRCSECGDKFQREREEEGWEAGEGVAGLGAQGRGGGGWRDVHNNFCPPVREFYALVY